VSKLNVLGWSYSIGLKEGIEMVFDEYKVSISRSH